jgi:hypothetical protein
MLFNTADVNFGSSHWVFVRAVSQMGASKRSVMPASGRV